MRLPTIEALWQKHLVARFPANCRERSVAGVDLTQLDADIAGCVETFLARRRRLDPWRLGILGICYRHAHCVTSRLARPEKTYFVRLERLAGTVLAEVVRTAKHS